MDRARVFADNWIAALNGMLAASGIRTRFRLVGIAAGRETDPYRADDSLGEALATLDYTAETEFGDGTKPDPHGYYDWVHDLREETRADAVHLVADAWRPRRGQPCGRAYLGSPGWGYWDDRPDDYLASYPSYAFGVSRHDCGATTFAHELGHNFGALHDRWEKARSAESYSEEHPDYAYDLSIYDIPYVFGYVNQARFRRGSPGWRWPPARDAWLTIMSYDSQCYDSGFYCYDVPRFSDPAWHWHGDPGGVRGEYSTASDTGPANVARMFREYSGLVAGNLRSNCLRDGLKVNLQAWTGDFVRAEHGGRGRAITDMSWPHEQSHLTVEVEGPGCVEHRSFIALRAPDGSYLRVPDGESPIADFRADRAERRTRFRIERIGHSEGLVGPIDDVALAAPGGSYLRVRYRDPEPDRPLRAEASSISPWERFVIRARQ